MSEKIRVTVSIDTDELRRWADHHADRGHHGVAHVLYKAASDGEGLGEQAIREAKAAAWDEGKHSEHTVECRWGDGDCICANPYRTRQPA